MGILDDAIREHLDLKRKHGARDTELSELEDDAFGSGDRPDPFAANELFGEGAAAQAGRADQVPGPDTPPPTGLRSACAEEPTMLVESQASPPAPPAEAPPAPSPRRLPHLPADAARAARPPEPATPRSPAGGPHRAAPPEPRPRRPRRSRLSPAEPEPQPPPGSRRRTRPEPPAESESLAELMAEEDAVEAPPRSPRPKSASPPPRLPPPRRLR